MSKTREEMFDNFMNLLNDLSNATTEEEIKEASRGIIGGEISENGLQELKQLHGIA